ncbi:MAG: hypothetical protein A3E78_15970 [Alphaproteobacteria bacterium RIFCSPHIGHO2_12_FULL_63_12]|nr:MAG: hypothetical protein A3E78_15970 [Alphaproteobacteria bacterium RIFCSPHIGHO2_12_FULL_63_12]
MLKLSMLLLCLIVAAAAAGRYKADAAVREMRGELHKLDNAKAEELSKIQVLRAEVAYLESPENLAAIATTMTDLEPLTGAQLLTAEDFELAFGAGEPSPLRNVAAMDRKVEVAQIEPLAVN